MKTMRGYKDVRPPRVRPILFGPRDRRHRDHAGSLDTMERARNAEKESRARPRATERRRVACGRVASRRFAYGARRPTAYRELSSAPLRAEVRVDGAASGEFAGLFVRSNGGEDPLHFGHERLGRRDLIGGR
ncbi:MAG: hypothetical protein ACT4PT_09140, partial [Methanobacteriota archaeon]